MPNSRLYGANDNPNNLAVTASVMSVFKEDICLKTQKTPYIGAEPLFQNMSSDLSL
jgi:hypothetical protein